MRNYRHLIGDLKCWDEDSHRALMSGQPPLDCILQNREELIALCEWIELHQIRSFLEIGVWTGRLVSLLQRLFAFEKLAICDLGHAKGCGYQIHVPPEAQTFWGSSHSLAYLDWRSTLGSFDLVLIDGDHSYQGVREDFFTNIRFPHKYLAFHDILGANPLTVGVKQFWDELTGRKQSLILPNLEVPAPESRMGIGIWSQE